MKSLTILLVGLSCSAFPGLAAAATVQLNGLETQIEQWSGLQAQRQVDNALAASAVQPRQLGKWKVLYRHDGSVSEVLQWHHGANGLFALRSRLDVSKSPERLAGPPLPWPQDCHSGLTLQSRAAQARVTQWTLQCRATPSDLASRLEAAATHSGWRVLARSSGSFEASKATRHLRLLLLEGPQPGTTTAVVLASDMAPRP
ncbi:MAG: hypothetical protein RL026_2232 [Pseudomonadota bacterium]